MEAKRLTRMKKAKRGAGGLLGGVLILAGVFSGILTISLTSESIGKHFVFILEPMNLTDKEGKPTGNTSGKFIGMALLTLTLIVMGLATIGKTFNLGG